MKFDHVAIPSNDIALGVEFYVSRFAATVLYQDKTWAFLEVGGTKVALVTPTQHPPHIALSVTAENLEQSAREAGVAIDTHRDGTRGIYLADPFGNTVELIHYPEKGTSYDQPQEGSA